MEKQEVEDVVESKNPEVISSTEDPRDVISKFQEIKQTLATLELQREKVKALKEASEKKQINDSILISNAIGKIEALSDSLDILEKLQEVNSNIEKKEIKDSFSKVFKKLNQVIDLL